jgi:hypothetical protein
MSENQPQLQQNQDPSVLDRLRERRTALLMAGALAVGGAHESTAQADTTPLHREALPTFTIQSEQDLAPAPGGPAAEAASTLGAEIQTPKDVKDFERRNTAYIGVTGESALLMDGGAITDWHGFLTSNDIELVKGDNDKYYALVKNGKHLTASTGRRVDAQNIQGHVEYLAGPKIGVKNDELTILSFSKNPKKLQRLADKAAETFMTIDQVKKLHSGENAYSMAYPLVDMKSDSPFGPDETKRQRQTFTGNILGLGTVNTNITQGIQSLWFSTHASKEDKAQPVGGASGAPVLIKQKGKIKIPGLMFAVNTLKGHDDTDNIGNAYTANVAVALNSHHKGEKIDGKNSNRVQYKVVYHESDVPGYETEAVAKNKADEALMKQAPINYVKGVISVPGLGQIHDAMLYRTEKYFTVSGVKDGELVTAAIKPEDLILDAFNDDGSDQVSIEQSSNQIDHQSGAFIDSNGNHLGELAPDANYTQFEGFKVFAHQDEKTGQWVLKALPNKYYEGS